MFSFEVRKKNVDSFTTFINQLISILENQKPQKPQVETSYQLYENQGDNLNNLNSTIDIHSAYIKQLKDLQIAITNAEEVILTVPLQVEQYQQHLNESLQIQRSKMGSSIYNSTSINQNSDIERAKINNLQQTLSEFIKNYSSYNEGICLQHNQKAEFVDISNDSNTIYSRICINCNQQKIKLSELLEQYLMEFFNFKIHSEESRLRIKNQIQTLMYQVECQNNIENFYIDMNKKFYKRIDIIDEILKSKQFDISLLSNIVKDFMNTQDDFNDYKRQFNKNVDDKMKQDLIIAQAHLNKLINDFNTQKQPDHLACRNQSITQTDQYFSCIKIRQEEQSQVCQALCFNKDDRYIATAKHNVIIIWNFNGGKMNQIVELKGHNDEISCLLFDKGTDALISAGGDKDCIINLWEKTEKGWNLSNFYKNIGGIKVMLLNKMGDQLIVGTQKSQILIFNVNFQNLTLSLIKEYSIDNNQKPIFGLSLNDEQNYLVQCGADMQLRLFSFCENIERKLSQNCSKIGMRIKFIDNQSFVLVQRDGLLIYYKIEWSKLSEIQTLKLSSYDCDHIYTPIWYESDRQLLIVKHFRTIYFLKLVNGKFEKVNELNYQYNLLFATVSNSGQYLVIWIGKDQKQQFKGESHDLYQIYELDYY